MTVYAIIPVFMDCRLRFVMTCPDLSFPICISLTVIQVEEIDFRLYQKSVTCNLIYETGFGLLIVANMIVIN